MQAPRLFFFFAFALTVLPLSAQDADPGGGRTAPPALSPKAERRWQTERARTGAIVRRAGQDWRSPAMRRAVEGGILSATKLRLWDEALALAKEYTEHTRGHFEEAIGQRLLGGLYLAAPHHFVQRNGKPVRGLADGSDTGAVWPQDRLQAIVCYERAREILLGLKEPAVPARALRAELIGVDFDLCAVLLERSYFRTARAPRVLAQWWWDEHPRLPESKEEEREALGYRENVARASAGRLKFAPDGSLLARPVPSAYTAALGDGGKVLFLLAEIISLDDSPEREDAARALFRRAMVARALFDVGTWLDWSDPAFSPLGAVENDPQRKIIRIWKLDEDEALLRFGSESRRVRLPAEESPLALLREVVRKFPKTKARWDAELAEAQFHQSRQQFPQALAVLQRLLAAQPPKEVARRARAEIKRIGSPYLAISETRASLPGLGPKLTVEHANLAKLRFTARRIDHAQIFANGERELSPSYERARALQPFLREVVARWEVSPAPSSDHRVRLDRLAVPWTKHGAYLVECETVPATAVKCTAVVFLTDLALVERQTTRGSLLCLQHAGTGQAVPGAKVRILEKVTHGGRWPREAEHETLRTTDGDGAVLFRSRLGRAKKWRGSIGGTWAFAETDDGRFAYLRLRSSGGRVDEPPDRAETTVAVAEVLTDRPLCLPGSTVRYRAWVRTKAAAGYLPPKAGEAFVFQVTQPDAGVVAEQPVVTDEAGGVFGEFAVPADAPLGNWHVTLLRPGPAKERKVRERAVAGSLFQVEHFRRPEFEVSVEPVTRAVRLGQSVRARIKAAYYFGAPVVGARATDKVHRWEFARAESAADEAVDGQAEASEDQVWRPRSSLFQEGPEPFRSEVVQAGELVLGPDGTAEIVIDTTAFKALLGDRDHGFRIQATVQDASRRVQEAEGSAMATRSAYTAQFNLAAAWFEQGAELQGELLTRDYDEQPVAVTGEWILLRRGSGPAEEEVARRPIQTGVDGRLSFRHPLAQAGHYRIRFVGRDAGGLEVGASQLCWVHGPDLSRSGAKFPPLLLIPEKASYRVGERARILVLVEAEQSCVLFSDDVTNRSLRTWRFLGAPGRAQIVEVLVEPRHQPNFFVDATVVRDQRVHARAVELNVPRPQTQFALTLAAASPSGAPGGPGQILVTARDPDGRPMRGELTLTAFDDSLTASGTKQRGDLVERFHGRRDRAWHEVKLETSLEDRFGGSEAASPDRVESYVPDEWYGSWQTEAAGRRLGVGDLLERADRARALLGAPQDLPAFEHPEPPRVIVTGSYVPYSEPGGLGPPPASKPLVQPAVRSDFSDAAVWRPKIVLDENGRATVDFQYPESLTRWRFRAWAISPESSVAQGETTTVTRKGVIVRLQSPRFFIERDEAVVSSLVHNYLATEQVVRAELLVPAAQFEPLAAAAAASAPDAEGRLLLTAEAHVAAGGQHRFDWPLRARQTGPATLIAKALTSEESDAMRRTIPVLVHGIEKQVAQSGSYRVAQEGTRVLHFEVPAEIDPAQTRLEVTLAPSLTGVLVDALPFLAGYPYGCTEQTISRFVPSGIVAGTLKRLGTDLETLARQRRDGRRERQFGKAPVVDSAELARMTFSGLQRLKDMQNSDGGWGWWKEGKSSIFETAYVLLGLYEVRAAGANFDPSLVGRAEQFLDLAVARRLAQPENKRTDMEDASHCLVAYVLGRERKPNEQTRRWLRALHAGRAQATRQGLALLAMAEQAAGLKQEAAQSLRDLLRHLQRDDTNETAWIETPRASWWRWWDNDIETNAWALRAILALEPQSELAPRIVKWLVQNRRGTQWRSTRDTALAIAAIADYLRISGEEQADYRVGLSLDGAPAQEFTVSRGGMLGQAQQVGFDSAALAPGRHTLTVAKQGRGALYYAAMLDFFTKESEIQATGGDLAVDRDYFRLVEAATGAKDDQPQRVPLAQGDTVRSGEQIEVRLRIQARNTYDYLAFEDRKPAGCEPVEVLSGSTYADGFCANVELRETKVVFFIAELAQGEHQLTYRLRAEAPGVFRAPPPTGFAMYAPELRANGRTMRLKVDER